jgi:hypothetical protein
MQGIDDSGNTPPSDIPRHYMEGPDCAHDSMEWVQDSGGMLYCPQCGYSVSAIIDELKNANVVLARTLALYRRQSRLVDEDN